MNKVLIRGLLDAKPEHLRTSCSDDRPGNWYTTAGRGGYPRCTRCALLKAYVDEDFAETLTLDFEVRMPPE
jgi:hypothetical protein